MTSQVQADLQQVLMIGLNGERVALDANLVRGILDPVPVARVPGARPFVDGVINVRGNVVPLADLRLRLGMQRTPASIDTRYVIVEIELDGDAATIGIVAEKVFEVTEIGRGAFQDKPVVGLHWPQELIKSIGKWNDDLFIVPDLEKIFN